MTAVGYTSGDERKLDIAGGTMTGDLILASDPTDDMGAATKQYVDTHGGSGGTTNASALTSGTVDIARLPVGTTSTTVAVGDDGRITGAAQKAANLSDLASATTARTNLGAAQGLTPTGSKTSAYTAVPGDYVKADATSATVPITLPTGTAGAVIAVRKTDSSANTVTVSDGGSTSVTLQLQDEARTFVGSSGSWTVINSSQTVSGLDTRYTRKSQNLADLASASTARTNLGLGGAALLNVGTSAGTVAAGDDSRFTASAPSQFVPADHGFLSWSIDPSYASTGTVLSASGVMHVIKLKLVASATISKICVILQAAATGTVTNCFAALYDSTGTRQGVTANLSTPWSGSTGYLEHDLTAPYTSAPAGTYYVTLLANATTLLPAFSRNAQAVAVNAGLTAPGLRYGVVGSSLTSAPSSITLSSVTAASSATAVSYFVGLK